MSAVVYNKDGNLEEDGITDEEEKAIAYNRAKEIMRPDFERQQAADSLRSIANNSNARSASKDANLGVAAGTGKNVDKPGQTNEKNQKLNDYEKRKQLQAEQRKNWAQKNVSSSSSMGNQIHHNAGRAANKEVRSNNNPNEFRKYLVTARNKMGSEENIKNESDERSLSAAGKSVENVLTGPKWKVPFEATKLGFKLRKDVDDHKKAPWVVAVIFAIIVDIADVTWIIGFFLKTVLFIFLWGRGTLKVKIVCRLLLFFDMIPLICWLPLSTISVLYAWRHSSKEAKEAEKKLEKNKGKHYSNDRGDEEYDEGFESEENEYAEAA